MALTLIHTGQLPPEKIERLVHEATMDERTLLEQHLLPEHPVLQQLNERLKLTLSSNHEMLL